MGEKSLKRFVLGSILLALILSACNIFNPSGEGNTPESTEGLVSVGQTLLQAGEFQEAMDAFEKAFLQDPTNSLARYSYAKAVRFRYNFNGLKLSEELTNIDPNSTTDIPFINTELSIMNQYYQTTWRVKPVLEGLIERDSLTRIWKNKDKPNKTNEEERQHDWLFNTYFTEAVSGTSDRFQERTFPISDGVINYEKVTPDMTLLLLIHVFADLKDIDQNHVLDSNDNVQLVQDVLDILSSDSVSLEDLSKLITSEETAEDVNAIIDKFNSGTEDISTVIELIGGVTGGLTGDGEDGQASAELTQEISETIEKLGSSVIFYKYNDGIDNDGDGCVDEEALDGIDNDGDGFIDEDSNTKNIYLALDPTKPVTPRTLANLVDPTDSSGTNLDISQPDLLTGQKGGVLGLGTNYFVLTANETVRDSLRFRILDMVTISKDTLPPYQLNASDLNFAVTNVGGCWKEY